MAAEVIIVGAGPVGLVTALALQQAGVEVVVLEARSDLDTSLRASTFHPPTLDMLADLGVAEALVARGLEVPVWQMRLLSAAELGVAASSLELAEGGVASFPLGCLGPLTRHPYRLQCEQHHLCELLLERLAPETVRFGAAVTAVEATETRATALVGSEPVAGRWLLGADGAHSVVRRSLGIGFGGETYEHASLLVTTAEPLDEIFEDLLPVTYFWGRERPFTTLGLPRRWRASLYPGDGKDLDELAEPARARQELLAVLPPSAAERSCRVEHSNAYRVHARCASSFRSGRVLLAGDAAHLNPPNGGMGMNGGIHDAVHFVRRFLEARRSGDDSALDGYAAARRAVAAQFIVPRAAANRERMHADARPAQIARLCEHQEIASDPERLRAFVQRTSMFDTLEEAERLG